MKKKEGVFIIVFLAVMVMGAIQPALLYSGETPQGNPWDFLIDPGSSTGTKWSGSLSIYYEFPNNIVCAPACSNSVPCANMYATVRLSKGGVPYAYYGKSSAPVCRDDTATQGEELRLFLNDALFDIYGTPKIWSNGDWKFKSIQNAVLMFDESLPGEPIVPGGTFVADIQIAVNE